MFVLCSCIPNPSNQLQRVVIVKIGPSQINNDFEGTHGNHHYSFCNSHTRLAEFKKQALS